MLFILFSILVYLTNINLFVPITEEIKAKKNFNNPCVINDIENGMLPDDKDCSKYHICVLGMHHVGNCPTGLLWNAETSGCEWPENVTCSNKNEYISNMVKLRCGANMVACASGGQCVDTSKVCDKTEDCFDGSDEKTCDPYKVGILPGEVLSMDGGTLLSNCGPGHAICASRTQCVIVSQLCDGYAHCPDGSDEGQMCRDKNVGIPKKKTSTFHESIESSSKLSSTLSVNTLHLL